MAHQRDPIYDPDPDDPELPPSWARGDQAVARELAATLEAIRRLCTDEVEYLVAAGRLAGLETGVVLAVTSGGLVPLFAHVSRDIFPVLVPAPDRDGAGTPSQTDRTRLN